MYYDKSHPITIEGQNMAKDQILTPEFKSEEITSINSKNTYPTTISDPNNIVSKTFSELKALPKDVLDHLGEIRITIEYQLVPRVDVTFKK